MLYEMKIRNKMMTGRHWLLAAVTALVLFCALGIFMPGTAHAATSVSSEDELRTALGRHDTDIVLTADITTTGEMTINNEGACSIDLNGHTISVGEYTPSRIFNIASNWGTDPKVSISNGTLSGGITATDGGAIYSKSSYGIQLTKVAFKDNSSGGNGGAVALEFNVSHERNYPDFFKITDCTFTNNSAAKSGGGMYIQYNDKDISDSAIATITRCTFDGNKATNDGGGLCVYSTQSDRQYQTPITDTKITNNAAGGCGGGLYVGGDTRVTMTGTSSGASVVSGNKTTGSRGGGIYLQGGTHASVFYRTHGGRLTLNNTTVDKNTSTGGSVSAGGIYIDAGSDYKESTSDPYPYSPHLTMTDSNVTNNVSSGSAGSAGGIYSLGGVVDITGGSISGNTAESSNANASGGGIYSGWSLKMTSVTVSGNESQGTFTDPEGLGLGGGGICNNSSYSIDSGSNYSMILTDCTISENKASYGNGGGISGNWGTNDVSALIKGCSISNNYAKHDGGGIHACWIKANKTLDFSGTNVISGNTAGNNDGGITLTGLMNMNVLDGVTTVKGNTAWFNAGGLFNPGSNFIEIKQGATLNIANNTATMGDGGGIFNRGSIGIFGGGTLNVDGNTAGRYGGGVYNGQFKHNKFAIQAEIKASTAGKDSYFNIKNNTAGGDGGGIYNFGFIGKEGDGNLITTVTGNTAAGTAIKKNGAAMQGTGGGISNVSNSNDQWTNTGTITLRNDSTLTVMGNTAKGNGGGIADFGDLNLKNSVKITNNTTITGGVKANNLYLKSGTTISASALSDDSVIGVTMQNVTGQVTNNASSDLASSFTSDDPYYGILNKGSGSSQTVWVSDAQVSFQAADGGTPVTTTLYNALEMAHNRHATITLLTDITSSVQYTVIAGSTVELNLNNHTISRRLPQALTYGGILTVEKGASLNLHDGTLQGGNSGRSGGSIDNNGTLSLENVQVKNCQTEQNGGAIYNNNKGSLTIADNVTIQNCKAFNGGGIYNEGTLQCDAVVTKNTASQNGGGLYNAGTGTTNFNNCHFNYNGAAQNGGGVYNAGKLISTQSEIISNSAVNGGGIFAASGGNLTVAGYTKVYYNLNGYKNNNLYLASGQTVNIADTVSTKSMYYTIGIKTEVDPTPQLVLTGNNSQDYSLFFISDDGHPIYNTGSGSNQVVYTGYQVEWGKTESYGSSGTLAQAVAFANAEAQRGTTVYIKLDQDVTPASYGLSGIGFYNASVVLDLNGHTIDRGLTTLTNQGAVITMGSYNLTVKNGTIKGGYNSNGGGIQALSESLTLDNVTVTGNRAGSNGGGVYALGSKVTLQNGSKITGNTAGKTGGGLYLASPKTTKPTTFSDTTQVTGNTNALGAANNVYLPQWYVLTASGLTTGANIGAITQTQPTAGNPIDVTAAAGTDNHGYFSSDNASFEAGNTISGSDQVVKLFARADAPAAPIIANKINDRTDTSITVYGIRGQEYSIDGGTTWQDSSTFTGLSAGTQYSIVTRIKATKSTIASKTSAALVTTTKEVLSGVTVKMDNYTYGDSKSPSVIGLPNGLSVTPTYYYKLQSDTGKGTKWATDRITPNAYVIYAEIPATEDYTAYTTATTGFTVTAKSLTIQGTTIASKVYDGTKTATVTPGALEGVLDGDTVVLSASAEFPSVNPGDQQVPVTYTISGSSAANYFAPAGQSVSGVITRKAASLSLESGQKADYTGNPAAYLGKISYDGDGTQGNWGYSTDGGKTWKDWGMPVDVGSYLIRLTYNQGTTTAAVTSAAVPFTITKANGTPVNITTTAITYGDTLGNSVIQGQVMVGDTPVNGTWSWTDTSIKPAVADSGTTQYYYTWIPSEHNVNPIIGTTTVTVNKATPNVSATASSIYYGQTLAASTLTGTARNPYNQEVIPGTWSWKEPGTSPGNKPYEYTFIPDDTMNYISATWSAFVQVKQTTPVITSVSATAITSGQTLGSSTLTGTVKNPYNHEVVTGTWSWTDATTTKPTNGQLYHYQFQPYDTNNYATVKGTVSMTVSDKQEPALSVNPITITYGTKLSEVNILGTAKIGGNEISGTWTWTDGTITPTVADSGKTTYNYTFTPTDTAKYAVVSGSTTLTVSKATPDITSAPAASAITYGQTISASTLTGGAATTAGHFDWVDNTQAPAFKDSGVTQYSYTFTPDDTANWNTVTGNTTTLTVNKATPVLSAVNAPAITVGQTLNDSKLGGTAQNPYTKASVAGTWAWASPATQPKNGDACTFTFTPDDAANYNTKSSSVKITVGDLKVPELTASSSPITYGTKLTDINISVTATVNGSAVAGDWAWVDDSIQPTVADSNLTPYMYIFVPTDLTQYAITTGTVKLTVGKATPFIYPDTSATAITYGQTLAASAIMGNANTAGKFDWTDSAQAPAVSDSGKTEYTYTFTPSDTANWNNATGNLKLTVNRATPSLSAVNATAIITGQTLADSTLTGTARNPYSNNPVEGTWTWTNSTYKPTANGEACAFTFAPADTANYTTPVQGTTVISISDKQEPALSVTPITITYGTKLSAVTIQGTAKIGDNVIPGTWNWTDGTITPTVADSGRTTYNYTFTPTETTQYAVVSGSTALTVNKATPSVSDVSASAITYGQALASSNITGTSSVPGSYVWSEPATPSGDVGSHDFQYKFKPTDSVNYNEVGGTASVQVNKATPTISAVSASNIRLGQTLNDSKLDGTANVAGTFAWTDPTTTPTSLGTANYDYTFTPTDTTNYSNATGKVSVTVDKGKLSVTGVTASNITYGQTLSSSKLEGTVKDASGNEVSGSFEWYDTSTILGAGDHNELFVFFPEDSATYEPYVFGIKVTVDKATPSLSDITGTEIEYGSALSASTISGTAKASDGTAVAGTFAWNTPQEKPGVSESATYNVTFTPTDTANYNTASGQATLRIYQTQTSLELVKDMKLTYGQKLSDLDLPTYLKATVIVNGSTIDITNQGTWEWVTDDPDQRPTADDSSSTLYTVSFEPTNGNYSPMLATVEIQVLTATPTLVPSTTPITYGDTLEDSKLAVTATNPYSGETVSGQWFWDEPNTMPAVSDSGKTSYTYEFCPDDGRNYDWVSDVSTTVTVNKATPVLSNASASAISLGQTIKDSTISVTANTAGTAAWDAPDTKADKEGTFTYSFTFTPTDTVNWNTVREQTASVTVTKGAPVITSVAASGITYGQTLKDSTITGIATGNGDIVEGSWSWTDTTIMPNVLDSGQTAYSYIFTPSDPKFDSVTGTVTLTVNKAEPTLSGITATGVDYGQTLADSTINGTASATVNGKTTDVPGTWSWQDAAIAPEIATNSYTCVFTPTETLNYKAVTGQANVTVGKVTPAVSGVSASDILQGQVLENSTITGVAKVGDNEIKGTWSFKNPEQEVDQPGTQTYDYIFTPEDQSKYNVAEGNVSVTVKAPYLSISCANIKYGDQLAPQFVTNTSGGTVSYQYSSDGGSTWSGDMPTELGTYQVRGTAAAVGNVPSVTSAAVTFTIGKADAVILEGPVATDITTKQELSDSYLAGSASVPGAFAWKEPDTVPGKVGDYQYDVTFTPTDTTHYNGFTTSATVSVKEQVAIVVQSKVYDGKEPKVIMEPSTTAAIAFFKYNEASSSNPWESISNPPVDAGLYKVETIETTISGQSVEAQSTQDAQNADPALNTEASVITDVTYFRIFKKVPTIETAPTASLLQYGQKLSESTLSGGQTDAIEGGTFAWNDGSIVPKIGTASYLVVFTPAQTNNYYEVAGYVDVKTAQTYAITVTSGTGGTITPAGTDGVVRVESGTSQTFTVKADRGYVLKDVKVDNHTVTLTDGTYTFSNVAGDHAITAQFTPLASYTISASADAGGSISDAGDTTVYQGEDHTYTITPDDGYEIADVTVDGTSVGAVSSYTFENIGAGHTISASFKAKAAPAPTPTASGDASTGGSSSANTGITTQSPFAAAAAGLGLLAAAIAVGTVIWRRKKD